MTDSQDYKPPAHPVWVLGRESGGPLGLYADTPSGMDFYFARPHHTPPLKEREKEREKLL